MRFFTFLFSFCLPLVISAQEFKRLDNVNSRFRETNLSITPNGDRLFFMSRRGEQTWSRYGFMDNTTDQISADGDIWMSQLVNGKWQPAQVVPPPISSMQGEDEPSISMDGQTVYFQSWRSDWVYTGGPYYQAKLNGLNWGTPVGLGNTITQFFIDMEKVYNRFVMSSYRNLIAQSKGLLFFGTDGMAVSPDGSTLVVSVTNYAKGYRNFDLYISRKGTNGQWSYPRPLGLNSGRDEISVFIAGDNKTIYFASDRLGGQGGYDIFKATLGMGTQTSTPENLDPPYNTASDEYSFIVNSLGTKGYMVRNGDIYEVNLNEKAKSAPTLVLNGLVVDDADQPLAAKLTLTMEKMANNLGVVESNSYSGEFAFSFLWKAGQYKLVAEHSDGRSKELSISVSQQSQNPLFYKIVFPNEAEAPTEETTPPVAPVPVPDPIPEPTPEPIQPKPEPPIEEKEEEPDILEKLEDPNLKVNEKFKVDDLYFGADATSINTLSAQTLDQIAISLRKRPNLVVEIGGHTNGLPDHEYCDELSTKRAKAIFNYLVQKGVSVKQLRYKGYGKRQPVASNETVEGRKLNQRVEFKILDVKGK